MKRTTVMVVMALLVATFLATPAMADDSYPFDRFTRKVLYSVEMENLSAGSFISAGMKWNEEHGLKDCHAQQIGIDEYGIKLLGQKIDEQNYLWTIVEKGKVVFVQQITKK